jgi:hypothetical protein
LIRCRRTGAAKQLLAMTGCGEDDLAMTGCG